MNREARRAIRISTVLTLFLVTASAAQAQQSTTYEMKRLTLAAAPARAASTQYAMQITSAQEGPVGSISFCNLGFAQTFGFWSLAGHGVVPTVVQASRNANDPAVVDLSWSGSATEFEIFRAEVPSSVDDPLSVILVTASCAESDAPPAGASIVYYLVAPSGS